VLNRLEVIEAARRQCCAALCWERVRVEANVAPVTRVLLLLLFRWRSAAGAHAVTHHRVWEHPGVTCCTSHFGQITARAYRMICCAHAS
jgi:hypothetical protein